MATNSATLTLHQELKPNDLTDVLQLLRRHGYLGAKSYDIALYLGLNSATLDVIKKNNKDDVESCLRESLTKWLKKADDVHKKGGPSIYSLVSALRDLGENGVAEGIEDEIRKRLDPAGSISDCCISDDSLTKLLPQLAANVLHSKGIIKKIKLPPDDPLHSLKEAIQKGVDSDDGNILKLAKVFKANGAADIATELELQYSTNISTKEPGQRQPVLPPLIFEDEIYGDIVIDHPLIIKIIKTSQFQRLKDIKQLGYTYQNIPKANYSRLQHSIGMYYLAGEYVKQLQRRQPELNITESDVLCVQIAALCFNLGHGPFSHTFRMFLKEVCIKDKVEKPWENVSEASVMMFKHMLKHNKGLMASFDEYLEQKDIEFIEELMKEKNERQFNEKEFLYEIILNKSQINVKVIDYTTRDAAVLGTKVNFKWRVFLTRVRVLPCKDGKLHICFHEDDLDAYNDFFTTHSTIYRELYYSRKIRIVAVMIQVILMKANEAKLIPDTDGPVTMSDAAKSMAAYTQLTDSVLSLIRLSVNDSLVKVLLNCLDTLKLIAQIGYVIQPDGWNTSDLKDAIVKAANIDEKIAQHVIIDRVLTGYDTPSSWTQHYYDDGTEKTDIWKDDKWAPQTQISKPPWRVFLVSGNDEIIKRVKDGLQIVIDKNGFKGKLYDPDYIDLMPDYLTTGGIFDF